MLRTIMLVCWLISLIFALIRAHYEPYTWLGDSYWPEQDKFNDATIYLAISMLITAAVTVIYLFTHVML